MIKNSPVQILYSRCKCGWFGTFKQLAILLRKDKVVSKICPECGIPSSAHTQFAQPLSTKDLVH